MKKWPGWLMGISILLMWFSIESFMGYSWSVFSEDFIPIASAAIVGLILIIVGFMGTRGENVMAVKVTRETPAKIIGDFLEGTGGPLDWDHFEHMTIEDEELDRIRNICIQIHLTHPATEPDHYCSDEGFEIMRQIVKELRSKEG